MFRLALYSLLLLPFGTRECHKIQPCTVKELQPGKKVIEPVQRWTREQKLALLDWHPMFTGHCPDCERSLVHTHPARVYWDCQCKWRDDSV